MKKRLTNIAGSSGRLLLLTLGAASPGYAAAATTSQVPAGVDVSTWKCGSCLFEHGFSGEVEAGAGYVSDDSFKFGEYNGLNDEGAFAIGNATARYRGENAGYLDLRVLDLGLDTRSVGIEGGRQGRYRLFLNYDEIPHYISDSARTPYVGTGGDLLTLPANWVTAGSTAGMTELDASLRDVDLKTERKRLDLGAAFIPASNWATAVDFRHETRDGQKRTAGAFFFNTAQLVEPVDYVTDEISVSATYTTPKWQSRLAYYGSFFDNNDKSLTWQNAYNPIVAGADAGQRALPPDNQFNQILLSSGYQLSERTRLSGDIASGRMEQNDTLLAATINPNIAATLPRSAADAKVDTLTANLKIDSAVSSKLRLNATYRYDDRDNTTPVAVFDWVTTDAFLAAPRTNLPYSFTDNTLKLGADYRIAKGVKLSAGYDYVKKQFTNQEVDNTEEDTYWGKVSMRAMRNVDFTLRLAHAERDASDFHLVAGIDPPQNPLMTKYNLADRSRDTGGLEVGFSPTERISIGLSVDLSRDDYSDSVLGLTESKETSYAADASVMLTAVTSLHAFASREEIQSEQAGSQALGAADWFAKNDDTIDSFGISVKHELVKDKIDVGADYVLSRSTGEVSVETGTPDAAFPDLKTDLRKVQLYADYRLRDNLTLHAAYWYENYDSSDWMLDGVAPDTVPNMISFGEVSPEYDVQVVMMSARYRF